MPEESIGGLQTLSTSEELLQLSAGRHRLFAALARASTRAGSYISSAVREASVPASAEARRQRISIGEAEQVEADMLDAECSPCAEKAAERLHRILSSARRRLFEHFHQRKTAFLSLIGIDRAAAGAVSSDRISISAEKLDSFAHEEQVRLTQQLFLSGKKGHRIIVFGSIESGNGCSRICAELAVALAAQTAGTVCVVDANFRSPTLHSIFGLSNEKGFAEAILDSGDMRQYSIKMENLWIMTSGARTSDTHALLASQTLRQRIDALRQTFDFVLIDAPPLNQFTDGARLGTLTDGVVMVIEANSTRRESARQVASNLKAANTKLLAAVLNRRTFPIPENIYRKI